LKNQVPKFENYSARGVILKHEREKMNQGQIDMIIPDKDSVMPSLQLGFIDIKRHQTRLRREARFKEGIADKDVASPDFYTHHDNAIERMIDLKACAAGNKLSNYGFSTSPRRDNSMYNLSDLSNIDHQKYINRKNSIDKYLELNNIMPHAETLALGYKKASMYDKIVTG